MPKNPKYVLLRHETEPGLPSASHWDIMLQQADCLWTWATEQLPADWLLAIAASKNSMSASSTHMKPIDPQASPLQADILEPSPLQSFDLLAIGEPKWASLDDTVDAKKEHQQAAQILSHDAESGLAKNRNDHSIAPGQSWLAKRLPDHRLAYLEYEGPISDNRGEVVRCLRGEILVITEREECNEPKSANVFCRLITAEFGPPIAGRLTLRCKDESICDSINGMEWELSWRPNS